MLISSTNMACLLLCWMMLMPFYSHAVDVDIVELNEVLKCPRRSQKGDFVSFHYHGQTESGKVVDSILNSKDPIEIQVGVGLVFEGLDESLQGKCAGQKFRMHIPAEKINAAIGEGHLNLDKNVRLIYEVEIISISEHATVNSFNWWDANKDQQILGNEAMEIMKTTFRQSPEFPEFDDNALFSSYMNLHDYKDSFISAAQFEKSSLTAHKTKGMLKSVVQETKFDHGVCNAESNCFTAKDEL